MLIFEKELELINFCGHTMHTDLNNLVAMTDAVHKKKLRLLNFRLSVTTKLIHTFLGS